MTKLNRKVANDRELALLQKLYAHFDGNTIVTRQQLREAHQTIAGKVASPHFITKNMACKVKNTHNYNFGAFSNFAPAGKKIAKTSAKKPLSMTKDAIRKRAAAAAKKASKVTTEPALAQ